MGDTTHVWVLKIFSTSRTVKQSMCLFISG